MRVIRERPGVRRSRGRGASRALAALATLVALGGCGALRARRVAQVPAGRETLVPVSATRAPATSRERLLAEAMRGVVERPGDDLAGRVQVRTIRIPRPARGGNARFNFDGGRRGWITAMPGEELLTSPAFARGRVYLGGGFVSHRFYALDAYSGELVWSIAAPDGGPSAAIVKDDRVIFNTESCTLFVVDAETGALRWSRWLGDPLMSQPAAAGDLVFSAYPKNGHHEFGAFRLRDGTPVWSRAIPADVIQAPQVHGDSVYFATMDGTATRLRRVNGQVVWQRDVGASSALWVDRDSVLLARRVDVAGAPGEQPVVLSAADGRVVSEGERVPAPYLSGTSRDRQLAHGQNGAWGSVPYGEHLGLRNVAAGWAFQGSTPAVADGRAYFAVGGEIRARDMATGREIWRKTYARAEGAQALSPPAVVGAQMVFGTVDGHVYAVDIDTGMTLWAYDVGEPVVFQPIVAQGWVYVATARGNLIGLEVGDPALDGWHMWGGNAAHDGLVETAGTVDPRLLASLERPGQGTLRVAAFERPSQANARGTAARSAEESEGSLEESGGSSEDPERPGADAPRFDLPLAHTDVQATVSGVVARVTVIQQFQNTFDRPIEAVYLLPLPADAAVDDMEMRIGERVVRARIQRQTEARRTYTEARASGRRAALLEQQRPNLFAQRVANIQPGERIDVRVQYVQTVPFEDGRYEFVFPMVAPRRYDPQHPDPTRPATDALAPRAGEAPAVSAIAPDNRSRRDIDVAVDLDPGLPLDRVESPTHRVVVDRRSERAARVQLAPDDRVPNRDFVLRYSIRGEAPQAAVLAHHADDGGYLSLVVQPPAVPDHATVAPREVTFVVDTSSSMHGRPMAHAQAAMRRVLQGLRPGDSFNVLAFADRVQPLAPSPLAATPGNVARGMAFVDALRASGTTEMVAALRAALEPAHADASRLRLVVLVTDGYIGNEADVLREVATRVGDARVYALGVGAAVNRFLLERASEVGRGRAVVATLSERPEDAADRLNALIDRPVFTDVEVDWGGLDVQEVYPRRLPDLFAARPLVLQARYARGGHATVRVRGTIAGRRYERAVEVDLPEASPDDRHAAQRTLWARAAVHDRMNSLYLRDDPRLIEEVTQLGLRHRIVTPWTSFVAVDDEPAPRAARTLELTAAENPTHATLSPARALPGDPEIRVAAPRDARAVTLLLPFGETLSAQWEPELGLWTARFLIPRDAHEGAHAVEVIVTLADGTQEHGTVWYTVDSAAPRVRVEMVGQVRPGAELTLRATQVLTRADLAQAGLRPGDRRLTAARAQILDDARRVEVRAPDGAVIELRATGPGTWEGRWRVPEGARGRLSLQVFVVDMAANVRVQPLEIEVQP
jgi:Ca-activated chloride channel family protein